MLTAREAALKALAAFRKNGAWSENVLDSLIKTAGLDSRDAALASRICLSAIQNLGLCDFYISHYSTVPLHKMEPMVADILRISVCQLLFFTKIPANAAVNEGVSLVKKYSNPKAAGLVNAVLRKISASVNSLPDIPAGDREEYLSIKYSHPRPLVRLFCEEFGIDECEKILAANNAPAAISAQVNTLKTDKAALMAALSALGVEAVDHEWLPDCLELSGTGSIEALEPFARGDFYVQDAAAKLAVMAAAPLPGMCVLDVCAAPGGKSFAAAITMKNQGEIISFDIHEKKLRLIKSGAERLGITIIDTAPGDAREFRVEFSRRADLVIADVPCSGLGVIRKKPDIRYKDTAGFERLPEIQLDILLNAANYVKPGGALLYSTCTILSRENQDVVNAFLSRAHDFRAEPFELPGPVGRVNTGMITLLPHIHDTDGFFVAKLRRRDTLEA